MTDARGEGPVGGPRLSVSGLGAVRRPAPAPSAAPATNYTHIFGTPLMAHRWADADRLNDDLRQAILAHEAAAPGVAKTNVGGWHSEFGRLEFCGEAGVTLVRRMRQMADEATARVLKEHGHAPRAMQWIVDAWANVNRTGHFNQVHSHPGSTWSGTYYIDAGTDADHPAPAPLHLFDPCHARTDVFLPGLAPSSFTIRPEPGLMVLFPSYLAHMVLPNAAAAPRIAVAFNLRRDPFP